MLAALIIVAAAFASNAQNLIVSKTYYDTGLAFDGSQWTQNPQSGPMTSPSMKSRCICPTAVGPSGAAMRQYMDLPEESISSSVLSICHYIHRCLSTTVAETITVETTTAAAITTAVLPAQIASG